MKSPRLSASVRYLALSSALCSVASAATVSWNLDRFGTLAPSNVAGVEAVANWNNSWPSDPRVNLVDDSGAATTLDLAYDSFGQWSIIGGGPGVDANGTYNRNLLNGYLNAGPAGWGPSITASNVALTEIPFANYSVIVYFSSDAAGREGQVSDGATTYFFNTVGSASVTGFDAVLGQTTDTAGTYGTAANYAIFSGLSGSAKTFTVQMRDNDEWGGIAGFQVVASSIPEPSSAAALAGVMGLALAGSRRRRA